MKRLFITLTIVSLSLLIVTPVLAQMADTCTHDPSVASLRDCVAHARHMGAIANDGVSQGLLAKLDAAQAALDRGNETAAINILQAFIRDVRAQAGKGVVAEHAQHMVQHAQDVIAALSQ